MELVVVTPTARRAIGAVLVVPGLHFGGAQEPRMRRFISVLAHAGLVVAIPNLPDYTEQVLRPGVVDDLGLALDHLLASDPPSSRSPLAPGPVSRSPADPSSQSESEGWSPSAGSPIGERPSSSASG